jgi:aminobenzoyl-glutamate utilization protein B
MDGIDAIFHPHVGKDLSTTYGIRQYGVISAEFTFQGKGAHSAVNPWLGRNALDAVVLMDVGWGMMRQQLEPTQRSHRVILNGGDQPNQIPSSTKAWWWFRDENMDLANGHFEKAKKIAEGAAIMTGCTYETNVISICWPTRANQAMAEMIQKNIEIVGMPRWSSDEQRLAKEVQTKIQAPAVGLQTAIGPLKPAKQNTSCNDSGSVSWAIPTGRINLPTNIPGCPAHTWSAAVSLATSIAHKGEVAGAKVLAASMLDLFIHEGLLNKVKESFANEIGDEKYFNILPQEQKPPTSLNSSEMERWRPLMEKHYVREKVRWL